MSRTNERIRESRRIAVGLGLSGAALVGLIYFEGMSARGEEEAGEERSDGLAAFVVDDADEPEVVVPVPASPLAMATLAEVEVAAELPAAPLGPALVVVPDIEHMTLRRAAKTLAAVGLKLSVRDEYGDTIFRDLWSEYEVREQKLEAGAEVVPGSTVKAKARARMRAVSGY